MLGKFAYLRSNFQRVLRKVRNTPSGSGGKPEPKWEYFKACSFLLPVYDSTSFESSLELRPQGEILYEGSLEELIQADFSQLYSPRATGGSPAPPPESTTSPSAAPCTSSESQTPSPQAIIETPSPRDDAHTPSLQDAVHTLPHQSAGLSTSAQATPVAPRGKKRRLGGSCDTTEKIVQALDHVNNAMNAFTQNQLKKPGKHDFVISSVQSFLNFFPISDHLKNEFGSKVVLMMHEYMQYYDETQNC